jgi:hypothetical protein
MDEFPFYRSRIIYLKEMIRRQLPDNRVIVAGSTATSPTGRARLRSAGLKLIPFQGIIPARNNLWSY